MRDGQATRRRILEAAAAEFSAYGIAGARVERIADAAQANKAQLYAYFGNKDQLFDAVWADRVKLVLAVAPLEGDDLVGYAVDLYDAFVSRPELIRLGTWVRLERTPGGHLLPEEVRDTVYRREEIEEAQRRGTVRSDLSAFDVIALVVALSMTWSPASPTYTATADESEEVHEQRRQLLASAVRRVLRPDPDKG
jgi:AcrR family transcriptional regulator